MIKRTTLKEVKNINVKWFSPENKRFFNDIKYFIFHDKKGIPYLIRSTYMWSDMFGGEKKVFYRINRLNENLTIGELFDESFKSFTEACEFLNK